MEIRVAPVSVLYVNWAADFSIEQSASSAVAIRERRVDLR